MAAIKDLDPSDRPRERLLKRGAEVLSDLELVAILLGSGGAHGDVLTLAARVVAAVDAARGAPDPATFSKIRGVGPAKAAILIAALEFSRRRIAALSPLYYRDHSMYTALQMQDLK